MKRTYSNLTITPGTPMNAPSAAGASMPGTVPTVRVRSGDTKSGTITINVSDFDPAAHTLAGPNVRVVDKDTSRPGLIEVIPAADFDPRAHTLVDDQPHT